jgi:hypothetical protein
MDDVDLLDKNYVEFLIEEMNNRVDFENEY